MTEFISIATAFRDLDDHRERLEHLEDVARDHQNCNN